MNLATASSDARTPADPRTRRVLSEIYRRSQSFWCPRRAGIDDRITDDWIYWSLRSRAPATVLAIGSPPCACLLMAAAALHDAGRGRLHVACSDIASRREHRDMLRRAGLDGILNDQSVAPAPEAIVLCAGADDDADLLANPLDQARPGCLVIARLGGVDASAAAQVASACFRPERGDQYSILPTGQSALIHGLRGNWA